MDEDKFVEHAMQMADYILDYIKNVAKRSVAPSQVSRGFLSNDLPSEAPQKGELFEKILFDFEEKIMPGIVHWEHPRFHGYFPASRSFPSILAEILSDSIGVHGFEWHLSPAASELESIVTGWYGQLMGLPDQFLHFAQGSQGGAIIQNSISECIFLAMLTARDEALKQLQQAEGGDETTRPSHLALLVAYCSKEAHSSIEKAALLLMVNIRVLDVDEEYKLSGAVLDKVVKEDIGNGLVPFFVCLTIGTKSCCACDPIDEIGPICSNYGMWLHVDADYAGSAMICPEYRNLIEGIEHAQSYSVDPAKWALVNMECAVLFATDRSKFADAVAMDRTVLQFGRGEITNRHSTRRCRALKLWFVLSNVGTDTLRLYIRNHVRLAKLFARRVQADDRFELVQSRFGLVCFRLKASNELNRLLLKQLNDSCKLYMNAIVLQGRFVIRFCVCYFAASEYDVKYAWTLVDEYATNLLLRKDEHPDEEGVCCPLSSLSEN